MTAEQYYRENIHRPELDWYGDAEITLTLMKEFAHLKCAEQREICAFEATTTYRYDYDGERIEIVDKESIRNAKNPEM